MLKSDPKTAFDVSWQSVFKNAYVLCFKCAMILNTNTLWFTVKRYIYPKDEPGYLTNTFWILPLIFFGHHMVVFFFGRAHPPKNFTISLFSDWLMKCKDHIIDQLGKSPGKVKSASVRPCQKGICKISWIVFKHLFWSTEVWN